MSSLRELLEKQKFYPGVLGIFINPFFFARHELVKNIGKFSDKVSGKLLDVGCGRKPYKKILTNVTEYIGMDIENPGHDHSEEDIDVFYDGKTFPFPDESFDSVLTNQVFEHVFNPAEFIAEINRVLKPSGNLLLTVPFIWDEHEQPFDYGRYSSFGIKHILEKNNFVVLEYSKSCKGIKAVFQLINLNIYKKFFSKNRLTNVVLTVFLISPFTILGIILSKFGKANSDLFLDNVVLARKVG